MPRTAPCGTPMRRVDEASRRGCRQRRERREEVGVRQLWQEEWKEGREGEGCRSGVSRDDRLHGGDRCSIVPHHRQSELHYLLQRQA